MPDITQYDYSPIFRQIIEPFVSFFGFWFAVSCTVLFAMLTYAFLKYGLNPFKLRIEKLRRTHMRFKPFNFIRWAIIDQYDNKHNGREFDEYGFTIYCGRQGAGKTTSMVHYLNRMHKKFPDALIVTNFQYSHASHVMQGWKDFFEIRNGTKGVIFAIDEIHSEYNNDAWKDFPEELLSEISQQRKQRVKIVATSQVYSRVVKQIREQCFSVVQCKTVLNRWTFNREYDAVDYELYSSSSAKENKLHAIRKTSFIQGDYIRNCFDTYEKIERLEKMTFLPRDKRVSA